MTSWIAQRHSKRERVCGRPAACVLAAALSASFVSLQLLAQGPTPAPPQLDVPPVQPIAWLDARKVGVHGLAVETNGLPYLTIDAQIDTIQSQIEKITLILQLAEAKRLDPTVDEVERTTAQGIISERRKDLADLQAKLASLLRQRELLQQFLERQQCGSGSREQAWKNAIATSQRVVDMLQPAEGRLVPELQEELTNHRRLIEEARGYLRDLTVECEAQKEEAFRREVEASIPGAVAKANKALDDAAPVVARGRFADMPAIRSRFAAAVPIERQLAYLGDPAADALLARVGEEFTTFVTKHRQHHGRRGHLRPARRGGRPNRGGGACRLPHLRRDDGADRLLLRDWEVRLLDSPHCLLTVVGTGYAGPTAAGALSHDDSLDIATRRCAKKGFLPQRQASCGQRSGLLIMR